jgi:hypothetical protein
VDGSASSDLDPDFRPRDQDAGLDDDPAVPPLRQPTGGFPEIADYWPDHARRTGRPGEPHRVTGAPVGDDPSRATPPRVTGAPAGGDESRTTPPRATGAPASREPGRAAGAYTAPPHQPEDPAPTWLISPPPPPRRPWLRALLAVAAALIFLGSSVLALSRLIADRQSGPAVPAQSFDQPEIVTDSEPSAPVSVQPEPSSAGPARSSPATTAAGGLPFTSAIFEMAGAVVDLKLTVADLGTVPFEFSTPDGSGLAPKARIDGGTVKLNAQSDGSKGSGRIDVTLNRKITWGLRMLGGVKNATYDLDGVGGLRGIDLRGGASRIEMVLPKQDATIPIRMSGGVRTWVIATPEKVRVKATLREGGGTVDLNGQRVDGVQRGATLINAADAGRGGLEIEAVAGLGSLTVGPEDDL